MSLFIERRPYEEITASHERCIANAVSMTCKKQSHNRCIEKLKSRENILLSAIFEQSTVKIISSISNKYIFLLTDRDGILLDITCGSEIHDCNIRPGISFAENVMGTNAISIAILLNKGVCLMPEDHYCDLFKKWYCYARPLSYDEATFGYIDVSTISCDMIDESIVIADLIHDEIVNRFIEYTKTYLLEAKSDIKLRDIELYILHLIAKGETENAIGQTLKMSINTVRYHKKMIFKKLNAHCSAEAIEKAMSLGLLA